MIATARNGIRRHGLNAALVAAIVCALWWPGGNDAENTPVTPDSGRAVAATPPSDGEALQAARRAALDRALAIQRRNGTDEDPVERQIAAHLDRLARAGDPDEQAARLCALGNLHMQRLEDVAAAAGYYERAIEEHPQWEGAHAAYGLLLTCYKRLGDAPRERLLYRDLLERYPENSPPAILARDAIGADPGSAPLSGGRPARYFD